MRIVRRAPVWVLSAMAALILLHVLVAPLYGAYRYDRTHAAVAAALVAVVLPAAAWVLHRIVPWLEVHHWVRRALVAAHALALVLVQLTVGRALAVYPGFDAGMVHMISHTTVLGQPLDAGLASYVAAYPNNWLLISVVQHAYDAWVGLGGENVLLSAVVLNALALTSSVCLAYLTARRMSRPATAYVLLGLSWIFIGLSPWVAVAYSDTLAMPFTAAVLYLFSVERTSDTQPLVRTLLWSAMAFLGVVGYHVKPTAVFVLGAVVVVALVAGPRPSRSWVLTGAVRAGAVLAGVVLATVAVSAATDGLRTTASSVDPSVRLDVSHFLKMGAQAQPGPYNDYYGVYSEEDVTESRSLAPGGERTERNVERYLERVRDMGPLGYPQFLWHKAAWFTGDGSFFMWGEGGAVLDPMPWTATDDLSVGIRDWFFIGGDRWATLFAFWQGAWVVMLLLLALTPLARRDDVGGAVPAAARLSILMLLAFLLLFEARARYLVLYLPLVLLMAALTLDAITTRVHARVRRAAGTRAG